jgi:polyferredoxin
MLAAKEFIGLLFPAIIIIIITMILGRVFCGWLCPLGTLLDGADALIKTSVKPGSRIRHVKYIILVIILTTSLFGLQLIGYFDPFSILVRGLTFSVDPGLNLVIAWIFDGIYVAGPPWLSSFTEPIYSFLKSTLLPYRQSFFSLSLLSFIILGTIFALEKLGRRYWCRNLCPLGALLALFSRFSLLRRLPFKSCTGCDRCAEE